MIPHLHSQTSGITYSVHTLPYVFWLSCIEIETALLWSISFNSTDTVCFSQDWRDADKNTFNHLSSLPDTLCVLEVALEHLAWIYTLKFWPRIQREDFFFLIESTLKLVRLKRLLARRFKYILMLLCHVTSFTHRYFLLFLTLVSNWFWSSRVDPWNASSFWRMDHLGEKLTSSFLSKKEDKWKVCLYQNSFQ